TGAVTARTRTAPSASAAAAPAAHAGPRHRRPVASQRPSGRAGATSSATGGGAHAAAPSSPASTPTVTTPSPARTSTTRLLRGRDENGPQVRVSSSLICAASVSVMPGTAASSSELGEHRARRAQLAEAAVDHEQVRQPAALARVAEAPAQHLGHRREVVRALDGADAVAAVAVLVGRPLVEGDDGAHGLAALEGRDVEALDALGRVGEAEPRLQLGRHALALL